SAQPPGLSLRLQQGEDVTLPHGSLHVADDGAARVVHELHAHLRAHPSRARPGPTHLRALPLGPGPAQHLGHL
ncbi:hypothetical protein N303_13668, partial [Cuculus canorus]